MPVNTQAEKHCDVLQRYGSLANQKVKCVGFLSPSFHQSGYQCMVDRYGFETDNAVQTSIDDIWDDTFVQYPTRHVTVVPDPQKARIITLPNCSRSVLML